MKNRTELGRYMLQHTIKIKEKSIDFLFIDNPLAVWKFHSIPIQLIVSLGTMALLTHNT